MIKTLLSNKGCASSIPGQGAKIPPALKQNKQTNKKTTKNKNRNSIVTSSIMTLKMVHIKRKKRAMTTYSRSFKNQNGVTVVQALIMKAGGHCGYAFRQVSVSSS